MTGPCRIICVPCARLTAQHLLHSNQVLEQRFINLQLSSRGRQIWLPVNSQTSRGSTINRRMLTTLPGNVLPLTKPGGFWLLAVCTCAPGQSSFACAGMWSGRMRPSMHAESPAVASCNHLTSSLLLLCRYIDAIPRRPLLRSFDKQLVASLLH